MKNEKQPHREEQGETPTFKCPECGREGGAEELFGSRTVDGVPHRQPWCRDCRAKNGPPPEPRPKH